MQNKSSMWLAIGSIVIGNAYASVSKADVDEAQQAAAKKCGHLRASAESRRIEEIVKNYFVARDKGWVSQDGGQFRNGFAGSQIRPGSAEQALLAPSVMARELAAERGLVATDVQTALADGVCVDICDTEATVTLSVGTALVWTATELGESSLSDGYTVKLEKTGDTWAIGDVAYAPIPSTDRLPRWRERTATQSDPAAQPQQYAPLAAAVNYNRQAAADYALRWSRSWVLTDGEMYVADQYNPDYDRQDNDCTNFVSQALRAGGWPIHDGWDNENRVNWSPDLYGPYGPSKTWSVAPWLYDYTRDEKRGEAWRAWPPAEGEDDNMDIWNLQLGDLIFPDWDPDGHFDGKIDHAMIVTGSYTELGFTEPVYSQHSPHRQNMPLSIGIKIATAPKPPVDPEDGMGGQGRTVKYYPVHIKDQVSTD